VHTENYLCGGRRPRQLEAVRRDAPVSLHGVGLSLGGAAPLDRCHLARVAALVERIDPWLVSEHLAWSVNGGAYFNDLLPLPYTEEALATVIRNVGALQDGLGRRVLIENLSTYLRFVESAIPEAQFLAALARATGCGILCDVNNIYVSCCNNGSDPLGYLAALPADAIGEIHLAGHAINDADGVPVYIDDHGSRVAPPVWVIYAEAARRFPHAETLVEWDTNIPPLPELLAEARLADRERARALNGDVHAVAA
jgi:uncharacterized protein (UPF0276 family)